LTVLIISLTIALAQPGFDLERFRTDASNLAASARVQPSLGVAALTRFAPPDCNGKPRTAKGTSLEPTGGMPSMTSLAYGEDFSAQLRLKVHDAGNNPAVVRNMLFMVNANATQTLLRLSPRDYTATMLEPRTGVIGYAVEDLRGGTSYLYVVVGGRFAIDLSFNQKRKGSPRFAEIQACLARFDLAGMVVLAR
jgi:hypothetical protein